MDSKLKKKLLMLKSFDKNLGEFAIEWNDVSKYNDILSDIETSGLDLSEFKVDKAELKPRCVGGWEGNWNYSDPEIDIQDIRKKLDAAVAYLDSEVPLSSPADDAGFTNALNTCNRFGDVARQLRSHRKNHSPLLLKDEYDVQYLLHALLKLHFDDVRPEERTQSYAGSSASADFVLPDIKVVIEVKFVRDSKDTKQIGKEIIEDIPHYEKHSDCERMFVLIYDPERVLKNPVGWKNDLEKQTFKGNHIQVFVAS